MSNWPMQTGSQEIVMLAMIELFERRFDLTLQVHDELHALIDEDKADAACVEMQDVMENTVKLDAPLQAVPHAGLCWEDVKAA